MTSTRNGIPTPRLEITTAAVRNPGITVELEPGGWDEWWWKRNQK